jgi:hypothetical protein
MRRRTRFLIASILASKHPTAAPAPERDRLFACFTLQSVGEIEERTVKHGSIIPGECDQTGFLHEAAEFDQMSRTLAAFHDPCSHIIACELRFKPMFGRCRSPERVADRDEFCPQVGVLCREKT